MSAKRMILLAAGSLTVFLSNADPGNRVLAQQPAARQQTLSETYRNSGDLELQDKVAPFKVFDNLYHVGPGYVDAWLIPTSAGIIMIDTAEEPFVDHVIDNIRTLGFDLKDIKYILISHGHLDHTTNRPFAEWREVFPNAACVVSLVDRLVHNAEVLAIEGESYRLKEAQERADQRARQRRKAKS
jgi:glyoxylase-like metal-dependent hydrolase (beta-lactamase superfamily II)